MAKVLVFDTSILCVWLKVPGKETCGQKADSWDYGRIAKLVEQEAQDGSTFVLPLAAIIETGNHISQCRGNRYDIAKQFSKMIRETADEVSPWAPFTQQAEMWDQKRLNQLADDWPELAKQGLSMGDATIKDIADFYVKSGFPVEILTGDQQLRNYQPALVVGGVGKPPRRRHQPA